MVCVWGTIYLQLERSLRNYEMEQPTVQARDHQKLLIGLENWSVSERLKSVEEMTSDALRQYIINFFSR